MSLSGYWFFVFGSERIMKCSHDRTENARRISKLFPHTNSFCANNETIPGKSSSFRFNDTIEELCCWKFWKGTIPIMILSEISFNAIAFTTSLGFTHYILLHGDWSVHILYCIVITPIKTVSVWFGSNLSQHSSNNICSQPPVWDCDSKKGDLSQSKLSDEYKKTVKQKVNFSTANTFNMLLL